MVYIYISIILLTMLSGCSWWSPEDAVPCNTQHITPLEEHLHAAHTDVEQNNPVIDNEDQENTSSVDQEESGISAQAIIEYEESCIESDEKKVTQKSRRAFKQRRSKKKIASTELYGGKSVADFVMVEQSPRAAVTPCYTYVPAQKISSDNGKAVCNKASQGTTLTIENGIDTSMLTVKHWSGTYFPTKLTVEINGQMTKIVENGTLLPQQPLVVPVAEKKLAVTYTYEFMQGMRKDEKSLNYLVTDNADVLKMSFNWNTPWHVTFDHAEPL
jgi:hypothetical protein